MTADERQAGGSGAGSTVELDLGDLAQYVVSREWLVWVERQLMEAQVTITKLAAARAEIERLNQEWHESEVQRIAHVDRLAALDAARETDG